MPVYGFLNPIRDFYSKNSPKVLLYHSEDGFALLFLCSPSNRVRALTLLAE